MRPFNRVWSRRSPSLFLTSLRLHASLCLATCGHSAIIASPSLLTQRRCKSFHFYLNLDDPEDTRRAVEETLEKLADTHKRDSAAYLHALLNLSLSYYQAEDYIKARDFAEYTHQKARAHNPKSSLLFLTATTCARCCGKLADEYEMHVAEAEAKAHTSVTLAPRPSVVFSAKRAIRKLREDATRYEGIAARIQARPDMAFTKAIHNPPVNPARRRTFYGEARTGAEEKREDTEEAAEDGGDCGGTTDAPHMRGRARGMASRWASPRGMAWHEDGNNLDEEFEAQYYGERWQNQRRRPEHAELKRHYQRHNVGANGGRYKVPK